MKTLTIHQPWAWAIVEGIKDVENRTWPTQYRGKLLIHSGNSKKSLDKGYEFMQRIGDYNKNVILPLLDELIYGSIIGEVEIIDCVKNSSSIWAMEDHYHWVLRNAVKYSVPIPCKGQLGLFDYHSNDEQNQVIEMPKVMQLSLF
jgi:hypothetical protein